MINFIPIPGFPGAIAQSSNNNALANKNVGTFALEVPSNCLTATNQVIGTWTGIRQLKHDANGDHFAGAQVSRLGNPLINEIVIGLRDKYVFNAGVPSQDVGNNFGPYVLYPTLPAIVTSLFLTAVNSVLGTTLTTLAPTTPRNDMLITFLAGIPGINQSPVQTPAVYGEVLRLNISIAPKALSAQLPLGVVGGDTSGFPNGRRPGDDVIDIALQVVVSGILCSPQYNGAFGCNSTQAPIYNVALTDGAPVSAADFQNKFPYLNYPYPGYGNGTANYFPTTTTTSPSAGPSFPSLIAISIALLAGFFISFAFFAF